MAISACIQPGAQISTMWMSSRSSTERQSVADSAQPYFAAAAATCAGVPAHEHLLLEGRDVEEDWRRSATHSSGPCP